MYLRIPSHYEPGELTKRVADANFEVYWEGLLFLPGYQAGLSSAQNLLSILQPDDNAQSLVRRTHALRGNWTLFIRALRDGSWVACADHSHQSRLYYSGDALSSSFLRVRRDVPDKSTLSAEALAAFLYTGYCMGSTAFYEGLKVLDYRDYIHVREGDLTVEPKQLPTPFDNARDSGSFLDAIDRLFRSLRHERLCVDLTGGTDSRSLVISLNHLGCDFDVATEGDEQYSEVKIARAVADLLGKELKYRDLTAEDLDSRDLRDAWVAGDGLDMSLLGYKFETWRRELGYSLVVSGFGGELHKDGGWYRLALASSLSRHRTRSLVDRLIACHDLMTWDGTPYSDVLSMLTPEFHQPIEAWRDSIRLRLMADYGHYPVFEAADRVFFEFSINRPAGTRMAGMTHYSPLIEPDLIRVGTSQPVTRRLNHRFYRGDVGRLNIPIAGLPTDRGGLTMSPRLRHQLRDWSILGRYFLSSRGLGRASRFKTENRNKSAVDKFILESSELKTALTDLKDRGLVNAALETPTSQQARRLLMLHYLLSDDH